MRKAKAVIVLLLTLGFGAAARAELSASDRQQAKKMVEGTTLYLRIDVPCLYGAGGFGLSVDPLVEVSPTDMKILGSPEETAKNKKRRQSIYWGFGPNDAVAYGKLTFKGDVVQVWMEGKAPKDNELILLFVKVNSLADFKAAFDQAFSKVPLQEEATDWPAEVKQAVAERRVVEGMTKRQAYAVVGKPVNIQANEENGKKVETWFPRQENGTVVTFRKLKSAATGFPALLKFVDGKLTTIEKTSRSQDLKLDK